MMLVNDQLILVPSLCSIPDRSVESSSGRVNSTPGALGLSTLAGTSSLVSCHEGKAEGTGSVAKEGRFFDPRNVDSRLVVKNVADFTFGSSSAPSLELFTSVPEAVVQGSMAGDSFLMSKVADKNGRVEESAAEDRIILGENPAEKLQTAEFSSDSSIGLTSKSHNSLCGVNGGKSLGVLETRVNKLQISSRFGPLAAVNEEETAVENCVLQENSADCVEEATLTEDISLIRKDEEGISNSTESQVAILQNSEEIRAKSPMVCSEIDLEKRVWQNSAADSDEEATLREDFSQLVHDESEIPSGTERQGVILQDAEKIKAKAPVVCLENSLEDGDLLKLCLKMSIRGWITETLDQVFTNEKNGKLQL